MKHRGRRGEERPRKRAEGIDVYGCQDRQSYCQVVNSSNSEMVGSSTPNTATSAGQTSKGTKAFFWRWSRFEEAGRDGARHGK